MKVNISANVKVGSNEVYINIEAKREGDAIEAFNKVYFHIKSLHIEGTSIQCRSVHGDRK